MKSFSLYQNPHLHSRTLVYICTSREMTAEEREEHAEKFTEVNEPAVVDSTEQEEEETVTVDESEEDNDEDSSTFEDDSEK